MRSPKIEVRIPEDLRTRLQAAAAADDLSLSKWVRRACVDAVQYHEALVREQEEKEEQCRRVIERASEHIAYARKPDRPSREEMLSYVAERLRRSHHR